MDKKHVTFDGSVPHNYDKYLVPLIFEDYAKDIAQRVMASDPKDVLETAAGTGAVTRHLHKLAPQGTTLCATDLNPAMLEVSKANFGAEHQIKFEVADALELPYQDNAFDVVACQFGIMFFPDKLAGMREAARVLRPNGKFVFSVWDAIELNQHTFVATSTLCEIFSDNPPTFMNVPFGYHQVDEIRSSLQSAGFGKIEMAVLPQVSEASSVNDVVKAFLHGSPIAAEIEDRITDDTPNLETTLAQALADAHGDAPTRAPMQAIVFEAHLG